MRDIATEVLAIADACLGGLRGHSALIVGPKESLRRYTEVAQQAHMKYIYEESTAERLPFLLPFVQLLISLPSLPMAETSRLAAPEPLRLTAASIAKGCIGRRAPLLIFDLVPSSSVEELAGLLPNICLYTPGDLHKILAKAS